MEDLVSSCSIMVLDNSKKETFSGWGNQTFTASIDIDYWADILLDYKVRVTAVDEAGNEIEMTKEIEGVFGGILKFLADIWNAIVGAIMAAWEAVVAALNFLIDWIVEGFRSGLVSLINGVASMIEGAFAGFIDQVEGVSNTGTLEDWEISLLMAPLAITAWDIVERVRNVFDCAEKLEITLSAILTATGLGGVVKTILSKVTLETVKKVLLKILLAFAIGALAESASKLLDRKELEDWTKDLFGQTSGMIIIVVSAIDMFEKISQYMAKRKATKVIPKSRYSLAVSAALVGFGLALAGVAADLKGVPLRVLDSIAFMLEIVALLVLTSKWWGKVPSLSRVADTLVDIFGDITSVTEKVLTIVSASSFFVGVGLHIKSGDYD